MEQWQIRVMAERMTLYEKLERLEKFIADDNNIASILPIELALLIAQSYAMKQYLDILDSRVLHFKKG